MKKHLFTPALLLLPGALLFAGCNSPSTENTTANTTDTPAGVPADPTPEPKAEATPAADYIVQDEGGPGLPPNVTAALKKAKVPPPPKSLVIPKKPRFEINTVKGKIVVELDAEAAPLHAKSFYYLAKRGFFNGTTFHRYEPGFVIQGGDPLSRDPKLREFNGAGGPGYRVPREYNDLKHQQFVLSMARSSEPDSAGSQFFITLGAPSFLDQEQSQDGVGYTVFGKVLSGRDVVMKIRAGDKMNKVTLLDAKKAP